MNRNRVKLWVNFLVVFLFFAGLALLRKGNPALTQFMPYVFHGLMFISAFVAAFTVGGLVVNWLVNDEDEHIERAGVNQFLLAGILFCLAAIGTKLWGGFPAL